MITYTPAHSSSISSYTNTESGSSTSTESFPNTTLFVGDLSLFTNEVDLYNLFTKFGEVIEIKIMRCEETMKNLSYGFAKFVDHDAAVNAMKSFHGYILNGRPLRIKWATHKDRKAQVTIAELPLTKSNASADANYLNSSSIHIDFTTDQLNSFVDEKILRDVFSRYGEVIDITLKKIDIDEKRMIQKGYAFVHFPANAKGVYSCLLCCSELKDTIVDGVKYRCDISHKLMKELNDTDDPEVLKILERNPVLMKALNRGNPIRKQKTKGALISALSQETAAYQYPYLAAYMTNLNPYSPTYFQGAAGYAVAASTTTTTTSAAVNAREFPINPYLSSFGYRSSSSESTSTDSMEGFINQVAFIDTRDSLLVTCPSVDYETGQLYTQFGQSCWNLHNASPIRKPSFTSWGTEFIPVAPPMNSMNTMNATNTTTHVNKYETKDKEESATTSTATAEPIKAQVKTQTTESNSKIETGFQSQQSQVVGYQITSPTWYHPMNSVLYPYYSYTQFPSPYPATVSTNKRNGFSPHTRRKTFTTFQHNQRTTSESEKSAVPPGLERQSTYLSGK